MQRPLWPTIAALLGALALVLQWALVAPAMAMEPGSAVEICTPQGLQTIHLDADGQPAHQDHDCNHCCLALASTAGANPPLTAAPVRYAAIAALKPAANEAPPANARGPPRPFGQGPPLFLNV